jgi:hypothetical protein
MATRLPICARPMIDLVRTAQCHSTANKAGRPAESAAERPARQSRRRCGSASAARIQCTSGLSAGSAGRALSRSADRVVTRRGKPARHHHWQAPPSARGLTADQPERRLPPPVRRIRQRPAAQVTPWPRGTCPPSHRTSSQHAACSRQSPRWCWREPARTPPPPCEWPGQCSLP